MEKAVIFDMDGLMFDSERATYEVYEKLCEDLGYQMRLAFYKTMLGRPLVIAKALLREEFGPSFPAEEVVGQVRKGLEERFRARGVPVKKGLCELLEALRAAGYGMIVASSSNRDWVTWMLQESKVAPFFQDIICGNEVKHGKPAPDIFLQACERLGCEPSKAWVLEDSEAGIEAAHRAGIRCICVPDMKEPGAQYRAWAEALVPSLSEAQRVILQERENS